MMRTTIEKSRKISLIAVISKENRAMGMVGKLLWKIEGDLPRVKALTTGNTIIMGRKTYETIGRPLPNRTNIVITRNPDFKPDGVIVVSSLESAFETAEGACPDDEVGREIFIFGGGEIYKQALPFVERLYLTVVDDEPEADTFFPDYSEFKKEISREEHSKHTPSFTYLILER